MGCCHSADEDSHTTGLHQVVDQVFHKATASTKITTDVKGSQLLTFKDVKDDIDTTMRHLKGYKSYDTGKCTIHLEAMVRYASSQSSIRKESAPYLVQLDYGQLYVNMMDSLYDYRRGIKRDNTGVNNLYLIQMAFWNFTDVSPELGRDLGKYGGIDMLLEDLSIFKKFQDDPQIAQYVEILLGILHNAIYMFRDNRTIYRNANVVHILTQFLNSDNMTVKMKALLVLAYCVDEEESSLLATAHGCVSFMIFMLSTAVEAVDHRVISENSAFSAKEILSGLNQLALNDDNKCEIQKENGVDIIVRMLQPEFTEEEQVLAAEGLWNLSFLEGTRTNVLHTQSIKVLDVLAKSKNPRLRQTSKYALWELKERCCVPSTVGVSKKDRGPHVMISYQWDSQEIAVKLRDNLAVAGFDVWMDVDQMKGDILNAMAEAIEQSSSVIVCMTYKYKCSLNCRSEASYAYKQEKSIIPVLAESGYKPDGWLGILLGMRLYYEAFTDSLLSKNITSIINAIREREMSGTDISDSPTVIGQLAVTTQSLTSTEPTCSNDPGLPPQKAISNPEIRTWSKNRVQKWFEENDIPELCSVLDFCDGKHLQTLYTQHSTSPDALQMDLKSDLGLAFHTRLKFVTALDELFSIE